VVSVPKEAGEAPVVTSERPQDFDGVIGQEELKRQLQLIVAGAAIRGTRAPHVLLCGPPGCGKTTLAGVLASEIGSQLHTTTGMMLKRPEDLTGLLLRLGEGDVLFIDEIHRVATEVCETLYQALEDGCLSVLLGNGRESQLATHALPTFTCVGATTRPGLLPAPFRARFGFIGQVEKYSEEDIATIVSNRWTKFEVPFADNEPLEVARRSKGTPRVAIHLADRTLDFMSVEGVPGVSPGLSGRALLAFGIDEHGLDRQDWALLDALVNGFSGRAVGCDALACALDVDKVTLTDQIEPPLVQQGLMARTRAGRVATPEGHALVRGDSNVAS
jgi:Holliday junction DNA helicase RuvB